MNYRNLHSIHVTTERVSMLAVLSRNCRQDDSSGLPDDLSVSVVMIEHVIIMTKFSSLAKPEVVI